MDRSFIKKFCQTPNSKSPVLKSIFFLQVAPHVKRTKIQNFQNKLTRKCKINNQDISSNVELKQNWLSANINIRHSPFSTGFVVAAGLTGFGSTGGSKVSSSEVRIYKRKILRKKEITLSRFKKKNKIQEKTRQ